MGELAPKQLLHACASQKQLHVEQLACLHRCLAWLLLDQHEQAANQP